MFIDRKSLRYLLEQRITTQNQRNWLAKLLGYEFDIVYKSGASNIVTNGLSCSENQEEDAEVNLIFIPYWANIKGIIY